MKLHFSTDSARISDPGVKLCPLRHFITSGGALCFCSKALWQNQSETRLFRLLRLSAGGKLSSPLTSEGQPEKNPLPKKPSPSHNPPGRAGGKTAGLKWRGRWKRAASFTASLLTVLLCVCVCDRHSACYPACCGGQWGQRLWVVTSCPLAGGGYKKRPSSITPHLVAAGNGN